jgi:molybdopterin converting factor small subunit
MIRVRCLGHIAGSVGSQKVELQDAELDAVEIVERLRKISGRADPGFTRYNTLIMVGDGEAFVPATGARKVREGEEVVLIPFSHGG